MAEILRTARTGVTMQRQPGGRAITEHGLHWRCRMLFLLCFVLALVISAVQVYRDKQPRNGARIAENLLLSLLVTCVGMAGVLTFIGDAFFADRMAASLGWPAGNPFQSLVAVANLSVGVLGILCYWIRGNFWIATVIGFSVWWLGAGAVHIKDIVVSANYAPNNAGATPYMNILVPIVLITLLIYYKRAGRDEREEIHPRSRAA